MKNPSPEEGTFNLNGQILQQAEEYIRVIREQFGIVIHSHQTKDLHKTIADGCRQLNCTPRDLLKIIRKEPANSPLLEQFIAGITVGETYFFRDKRQIQLLNETILPALIRKRRAQGQLSLRIWSAGCASGEEIYTIAILLHELLPDFNTWKLHLLGTDINISSIKKAIQGCYSEWSMRAISETYKKRYFSCKNRLYSLLPSLQEKVNFTYLNLKDNTFPSIINDTNAQDLILCRNVLIYFDSQTIPLVMKKLSASLVDDGYLLLGASDPIEIKEAHLHFHYQQGALFTRTLTEATPSKIPLATPKIVAPLAAAKKIKQPPQSIDKKVDVSALLAKIHSLWAEGQWQALLDIIHGDKNHELPTEFAVNTQAIAYANLGKLEQAVKLCQDNLQLHPTDTQLQFTFAMILLEQGQLTAAENALRKTLFLDHQFVMGHYELGLLLLRNKQFAPGIKSLRNALTIAQKKEATLWVSGTPGLNYGKLAEILAHELAIHLAGGERDATDPDETKKQKA